MLHRKTLAILILIAILAVIAVFLPKKSVDPILSSSIETSVRNLSWQTDFAKSVPYKKGDELEYAFILRPKLPSFVGIDLSRLSGILDITSLELDGVAIDMSKLSRIPVSSVSLLKIRGKAKTMSPTNAPEKQDVLIDMNILETIKQAEETGTGEIKAVDKTVEPIGISFRQKDFNSNLPNLLEIHGEHLENIEFVNIGEKSFPPVSASGTLYVRLDRNTFASGEYFVFFSLKNGKILPSGDKLTFEYSPSAINIGNVTPKSIPAGEERYIVIQGNGFEKIVSIQLSNNVVLTNAEFRILSDHVAGIRIPKGLPPGTYSLNIMDTKTIYELKNATFTITP